MRNGSAAGLTSGNTAPTPGGFYYEVLTAPSTVTSVDTSLQALLSGVWSDTGLLATNTPFSAGGRAAAGGTRVVNNWAPGLMQSFIVVGWSADHGTTWAQVAAQLTGVQLFNIGGNYAWNEGPFYGGWLGASTIQQAQSGAADGTAAFALFGAVPNAQGTPIITPTQMYTTVPEPSAIGVAILGVGTLMSCRARTRALRHQGESGL